MLGNNKKIGLTLAFFAVFISLGFFVVNSFLHNKQPVLTNQNQKIIQGFFTNKQDYEEAFDKLTDTNKQSVGAAITSHHFLAKDLIAKTFFGINNQNIKRVIIVGPDHFHQLTGTKHIAQTTTAFWQTPYGKMEPDIENINLWLNNKKIVSHHTLFRNEHAIYLLVPFAKKTFPEAKIIPLIVRQKPDFTYFFALGKQLGKLVNPLETLLIVSSDFAHDVTLNKAQILDKKSISLLKKQKLSEVSLVENDCKQCLALLYGYLSDKQTQFYLVDNKNSQDFSQDKQETVTSYVAGYFW